jgi:hypothetical protein
MNKDIPKCSNGGTEIGNEVLEEILEAAPTDSKRYCNPIMIGGILHEYRYISR